MDRATLLTHMDAGRERLMAAVDGHADAEWELPRMPNGWSLRDLVAHLCAWEELAVGLFDDLTAGREPPDYPEEDVLNERFADEWRGRSVMDVRQREAGAFDALRSLGITASDDELFAPGHFAWCAGEPFWRWLEWNTWDHSDEHLVDLAPRAPEAA